MAELNAFERKLLAEIALAGDGCGTHEAREELKRALANNAVTDELVRKAVPRAYSGVVSIKETAAREGRGHRINEPVFLYFAGHNKELEERAKALRDKLAKAGGDAAAKKKIGMAIKGLEQCRLRVERKGQSCVLMHGNGVVKKVGNETMGPLALLAFNKRRRR